MLDDFSKKIEWKSFDEITRATREACQTNNKSFELEALENGKAFEHKL